MDSNIFVGRQPIFNQKEDIYAYELLYRNSDENSYPDVTPTNATIELLINTFLNIGYDDVTNRAKMFINFSEELLYEEVMIQLDARLIVIEVLEDVEITSQLIRQLRYLKKQGFTIALDDFMIEKQTAIYDDLYKIVQIIKVDFQNTSKNDKAKIEALLKYYPHLTLLAEKVETRKEYEYALNKGYHLFQGYLFAKPEIIKGKDILSKHTHTLLLFQKINEKEPDINQITDIIKRDVSLSYKLLRVINSFAFNVPNKISSIKQAVMMMGLVETRKWLQLLLFYDMGSDEAQGREQALIEYSIIRARSCELLAQYTRQPATNEYFLLGMFSYLDVIMNKEWTELLPKLSLAEEIELTLLNHDTLMQDYLHLVKAVEKFDIQQIKYYAAKIDVPVDKLNELSLAAHRWAVKAEY